MLSDVPSCSPEVQAAFGSGFEVATRLGTYEELPNPRLKRVLIEDGIRDQFEDGQVEV